MSRTRLTRRGNPLTILPLVLCLFLLPVTAGAQQQSPAAIQAAKPLIVFYSLTGKNKIISDEVKKQLGADIAELKTVSDRSGIWGFVVSGYENIFDKETDLQPLAVDIAAHNPIIICTPVWMQKLSSPARTFLKNPALKGKDIYIFASFNGHWAEDKEAEQLKNLTGAGLTVKGISRMVLGKKNEAEIRKEVDAHLQKKPIIVQTAAAR
jgi:flavodoxin